MPLPKPKGSFRGAGFYTESHSTKAGHRHSTHALPFQDKGALHVSLGRAPRQFNITGVLVGPDYRTARDALMKAFELPGPGLLVHPEHGRVLALVDIQSVNFTEETSALDTCKVAFTAIESAEKPPQVAALDTASALKASAKLGRDIAGTSFENPATGLKSAISDFVKAAHLDVLDNVLTDIRSINGAIASLLAVPVGFAAQIDSISRELATLINTPRRLFDAINETLGLLAQATRRILGPDGREIETSDADATSLSLRRGKVQLRAVAPMATLGSASRPVPDIDTEERRDQAQGQRAIQNHMRAAGLLALADAVADAPFDSAQDAGAVRDALANALADLADTEPELDAPLVAALKNTASAVLQHLNEVAGKLAEVVTYTPADTLPIEVIAWTLYADAERADEIWLRNPSIKHPGLVAGKVDLEVRST